MATATLERTKTKAPDLSKYRGKWIAIRGDEVLAAGATPNEVLRQVAERKLTGWVLDRVPDEPDSIFVL